MKDPEFFLNIIKFLVVKVFIMKNLVIDQLFVKYAPLN